MTKYFFVVLISVFLATACDESPPPRVLPKGRTAIIAEKPFPKDKNVPIDIPPPPAPYTGPKKFCFEKELGNDPNDMTTMQFVLDDNDSIHGRLDHSFANRLPIHGTVVGVREGTFLELNYMYSDSGAQSTEQLILKMEGDKIFKKTGPLVEENGVLILENPLQATFQLFLMKVECK